MVDKQAPDPHPSLDAVFHALGDATRRGMLTELAGGTRSVGELAKPFAMSFAGASKHVKALESAGLVHREIRGRVHVLRLAPEPLAKAHAWIAQYEAFWSLRLDALEQALGEDARGAGHSKKGGSK